VLITGGAGFIGSHLAEALVNRGCRVTVIDDLSTGRFENIQRLVEKAAASQDRGSFHFAIESITNQIVVDRLVSECDVIFHLAAAVGVKLIVEDPVRTIETNVMATEAVLKAALRYRVKVLIGSTSEVYGKSKAIPFNEDDDVVLGPTSRSRWSYASSKMVDEFLGLAYHAQRGLPVVIPRLFNTTGPRQTGRYGMVVPRFVDQALRGEPLTVYGDGRQSRCFCDVDDVVRALVQLAECPEAVGQVFNVGSADEVTILDLARRVLASVDRLSGRGSSGTAREDDRIRFVPYEDAYRAGFEDMPRRVPDIRKIKAMTGWAPTIPLQDTLERIIKSLRDG
jgi:UDP-glucose 4-epimerase